MKVIRVELDEKRIDLRIVGNSAAVKSNKNNKSNANKRAEKSRTAVKKKKSNSSKIGKAKMALATEGNKKIRGRKQAHNKSEGKDAISRSRKSQADKKQTRH